MTNLKSQYADEIIKNMVNNLNDEEFRNIFKSASFEKEAQSDAFKTFYQMLPKANDSVEVEEFFRTYAPGMMGAEREVAEEAKNKRIKELSGHAAPGSSLPPAADDECLDCEDLSDESTIAIGFALNHLVKISDALDKNGFNKLANFVDETMEKISKYKGKGEKPPKGAEHKAPKGWWDKMEKEIGKKNADYSKKRIGEVVGDIWDNELSDKKRKEIYKEYGKTKNPNK